MRYIKYLGLLVLGGILAYWLVPVSSPAESTSADAVYLCRETKALIRLPAQAVPAVNPHTGRATLFRALYCAACRKWHPVPPPEVFAGNPMTYPCPNHQCAMTADGPIDAHSKNRPERKY